MLRVEALEVAYGKIQALWGISVEIPEGEIVAVVGANGAGKTTMLKTLSGLLRPMAGRISLDDRRIDVLSPAEIVELGVVHVPEGRKLFPEMTVLDNLLVGGYPPGARSRRPQRLEHVFTVFPRLGERRRQLAGTLSGGEQQMVAIGRRSPDSVFSIVVLPAPLAPTTATISPSGISTLIPQSAWILP